MQITVLDAGKPYKDGKFFKLDFQYEVDGKERLRKLVAVGDSKPVFEILKDAQKGDKFEIKLVKDGDYFNWTEATKLEAGATTTSPTKAASLGSSDALRQRLIVRQSCLSNAINYYAECVSKSNPSEETILATAQRFMNWVYSAEDTTPTQVTKAVAKAEKTPDLNDDIPF